MKSINTKFTKAWKLKGAKIDVCYEETDNKVPTKNAY